METQGALKRLSVPNALFAGSGQALSRPEANSTREFWITMTMPALMIASAMHRLTKVPTAEPDQPATSSEMFPAESASRSGAPTVIAITGTRMTTTERPSVHSTVRATLRRGFSSSSER